MLASAAIRAAELLAVLLITGTVTLAAGLWWLRRPVRRLKLPGRAAARAGAAAAGAVAAGAVPGLVAAVSRPPLARGMPGSGAG